MSRRIYRPPNEQERDAPALTDPTGQEIGCAQVAKYGDGVSDSENSLVHFLGGTTGVGLIARVVRGYTFISRNYVPVGGSRIFNTGFSRAAYTARALAGLIVARGLLDASLLDLDDKDSAYRLASAVWHNFQREIMKEHSDG